MDLQELYAVRDRMVATGSFGPSYGVTMDAIREAESRLGVRLATVRSLDVVAYETPVSDTPKKS